MPLSDLMQLGIPYLHIIRSCSTCLVFSLSRCCRISSSIHFVKGSTKRMTSYAPEGLGGVSLTMVSTHHRANGWDPLVGGYRYGGFWNRAITFWRGILEAEMAKQSLRSAVQ